MDLMSCITDTPKVPGFKLDHIAIEIINNWTQTTTSKLLSFDIINIIVDYQQTLDTFIYFTKQNDINLMLSGIIKIGLLLDEFEF